MQWLRSAPSAGAWQSAATRRLSEDGVATARESDAIRNGGNAGPRYAPIRSARATQSTAMATHRFAMSASAWLDMAMAWLSSGAPWHGEHSYGEAWTTRRSEDWRRQWTVRAGQRSEDWHANERTATARSSSVGALQGIGIELLSPATARPGSALTGVGTARQGHGTALTGFGIDSVARQGHGFALTGFG